MSYRQEKLEDIPAETRRVAQAAFPKGNIYMMMRDELGILFEDVEFKRLYSRLGQPSESAWRLTLITIMQFAEGLTDRQTADAVRGRIDWKYALGLELTDEGFDFSVLSEFRKRIIEADGADYLLGKVLNHFKQKGLLKNWKQQRTDATHILGHVRRLNQLELVGETLRATLNAIAVVDGVWLRGQVQAEWFERYSLRLDSWRLPHAESARQTLALQIGQDGFVLLQAIDDPAAPSFLREVPAVKILRQVWQQQFTLQEGQIALCNAKEQPRGQERINSPYETQVRWSQTHDLWWLGYKAHITETYTEDDLHLITHVETTPATTVDHATIPNIHAALDRQDLLPEDHLADAAYIDAQGLVDSQHDYGVNLIGPAHSDRTWQAEAKQGFDISYFQVDWVSQQVICPMGQTSSVWQPTTGRLDQPIISVRFATATCRECPVRTLCTHQEKRGRRLSLLPQPLHEAIQAARSREKTEVFKNRYAKRAGVESTFSQAVRVFEIRRSRYRGLVKTHVQHVFTAIAINLIRAVAWLTNPTYSPVYISPFAALANS